MERAKDNPPPSGRNDAYSEYYSVREDRSSKHAVHEQLDFTEWTVSKRRSSWKVTQKLVGGIEILITVLTSAFRSKQNAYPEFLVSISGREYFCIYFDSVIRECYISLWSERSETFLPDLKAREILTFMLGGTEGALSSGVGFEMLDLTNDVSTLWFRVY